MGVSCTRVRRARRRHVTALRH